MGNDFLGTGVKFPVQVDKNTGRFMLSVGEQSVKESLYIILMTQRGERLAMNNFGSRLNRYAFGDTGTTMLNIMANDIRQTIMAQEPRIAQVDIDVEPPDQEGRMLIHLEYTLAGGYTADSLVFPFYLEKGGLGEDGNAVE